MKIKVHCSIGPWYFCPFWIRLWVHLDMYFRNSLCVCGVDKIALGHGLNYSLGGDSLEIGSRVQLVIVFMDWA